MKEQLKKESNYVELMVPVTSEGIEYPIGTKGYLYGALDAEAKGPMRLMMIIENADVDISDYTTGEINTLYKYTTK